MSSVQKEAEAEAQDGGGPLGDYRECKIILPNIIPRTV